MGLPGLSGLWILGKKVHDRCAMRCDGNEVFGSVMEMRFLAVFVTT